MRRASAGGWFSTLEKSSVGERTLSFDEEVQRLFTDDTIEDIRFVISYGGLAPDWLE